MKIAIHTQELEAIRIDGTRNYIAHLLQQWVRTTEHDFYLIHQDGIFNPVHAVPVVRHFHEIQTASRAFWTQIGFSRSLKDIAPDVVWMPIHNLPVLRPRGVCAVVTIHDLAFKKFPDTFPLRDRLKHNVQTAYALHHADHVIAVSTSTKDDILTYYPTIDQKKISVVHHGIDAQQWNQKSNDASILQNLREQFSLVGPYMIYVGALQPRKNIERLISAYEMVRRNGVDITLVLAGAPAWLSHDILTAQKKSPFAEQIIVTGTLQQEELRILLRGAIMSVYVSLYEGFGIPVLESFASGVPVLTARHSSLPEVAGDCALYVDPFDVSSIASGISKLVRDEQLRQTLAEKGSARVEQFSWATCAAQTLHIFEESC